MLSLVDKNIEEYLFAVLLTLFYDEYFWVAMSVVLAISSNYISVDIWLEKIIHFLDNTGLTEDTVNSHLPTFKY